jgi:ATP-binding cassette subfamily B protein
MGLPRALVSARRINDVISTEITVVNGSRTDSEDTDVCISFKDVSFAYPESSGETLSGISFEVMRGETVAVIGQTGSGKTSLVNLIPRLFDATGGSVYVDGVDVREYDLDTLRSKIGYATQKPILFSGSAGFNIGYGCHDVTYERMMEAAKVACIDSFLESNDGLDTVIEQLGANLSGGQKQRISIARAVCKRPEIYIFDDTFSALDFKTDLKVRSNLKRFTADATTIIVSQRISTIADADKIIVISDGEIVGAGKHDELMKGCDIYKEMAKIQEFGEVDQ